MRTILTLVSLLMIFIMGSAQECETSFDFTDFVRKGTPDADWQLISNDTVINTAFVYPATFFVNKQKMINVLIKGTLSVQSDKDDDFIGIVFGYHQPTNLADDNSYNFYLFDWKAKKESFTYGAFEGFRLSHYNGFIPLTDQKKYMWGTVEENPVRSLLKEKYGDELGWEPFTTYQFELLYTSGRIRIKIDDEIIFEVEGCFNSGRFGFYCMSQEQTRFENFSYKPALDFVPKPAAVCVGEPIAFSSFDANCTSLPGFVESVKWEFGDGQSSTAPNTSHTYDEQGEYPVLLIVKTTDGCIDSTERSVKINAIPVVDLGDDMSIQACSSVTLDAGNPGADYLWSTGSAKQTIELMEISSDTNVWVTVNKHGCISSDSILIEVEPILYELYFPNAFSPNGDGINDLFLPVGITDDIAVYRLTIFDRWGQLIFDTNDPHEGWNGLSNRGQCETGTYAYKAVYTTGKRCSARKDFSELATLMLIK